MEEVFGNLHRDGDMQRDTLHYLIDYCGGLLCAVSHCSVLLGAVSSISRTAKLTSGFSSKVTRACLAMAYPPQLTGPGEVLEDFTHGDLSAVPSNFAHNDMHSNNGKSSQN